MSTESDIATTLSRIAEVEQVLERASNDMRAREAEGLATEAIRLHPKMVEIIKACCRVAALLDSTTPKEKRS